MNVFLYGHGGAKNHGCEAIVRSTVKVMKKNLCTVYSLAEAEDKKYGLFKVLEVNRSGNTITRYSLKHLFFKFISLLTNIPYDIKYLHSYFRREIKKAVYLSIGGDNYCYGYPAWLIYLNKAINQKNGRSVLWGCSITPQLLEDVKIIEDLKTYALITARESITYHALLAKGITETVKLYPDPAFVLDTIQLVLPRGFSPDHTIGINLSPLIMECEVNKGKTMENYTALLAHIIQTTDLQIALIPHVIWERNDDRKPLRRLYDSFSHTGRVVMIEDHNCMELKGYIARCRMFIGARTHATIAAYSSCVPTLVVGYSVKAKGIAKDIFGTYENYVIPVQTLASKNDLIQAFEWMKAHEDDIRRHLEDFMPGYIAKAYGAGREIERLIADQEVAV